MIPRAMESVLRRLPYSKRQSCPQLIEASFSKFFDHSSASMQQKLKFNGNEDDNSEGINDMIY